MIKPGDQFTARNQGRAITPHSVKVTVVWVNEQDVHYRIEGEIAVKQTTLARFMEIVGLPMDDPQSRSGGSANE